MNENQAQDDLKAIRSIMDRTRQATSGQGGWFMVTGGAMWLIGFLGQQFLPPHLIGWMWLGVNAVGLSIIAWLYTRTTRHGHVSPPLLRSIMLAWLALGVFDALFVWLFGLHTERHILLLILVTTAVGCVQMGLIFSYWPVGLVGLAIGASTITAFYLIPDYFFLIVACLGGGTLIGGGMLMVRSDAQ